MNKGNTKTFMVVISPDSTLTPAAATSKAITLALPVTIKETCFGMLIEGERRAVEKIAEEIRKLDPNKVFIKVRGFPVGDSRICRAKRGGGSRPGFHQLEGEYEFLPLISHALEKLPSCTKEKDFAERRKKHFPVTELKKLVEVMAGL